MKIEDVTLSPDAESWVKAAFAKQSYVGGGSNSLVLDAEDEYLVVKLTQSESDCEALIHFSGVSQHFPKIIEYARNQGQDNKRILHALMIEKLPIRRPLKAEAIANYINSNPIGRDRPFGLFHAAEGIRSGEIYGEKYPESLADALRALGNYASEKMLRVDLHQRDNWGERADGTLVILDPVYCTESLVK